MREGPERPSLQSSLVLANPMSGGETENRLPSTATSAMRDANRRIAFHTARSTSSWYGERISSHRSPQDELAHGSDSKMSADGSRHAPSKNSQQNQCGAPDVAASLPTQPCFPDKNGDS